MQCSQSKRTVSTNRNVRQPRGMLFINVRAFAWRHFARAPSHLMARVEVCVYSVTSALRARYAGADTIELCGGQAEGGTTPSIGLIKRVRKAVSIPIHVMIRPRGGDFYYSSSEIEVMEADIDAVKETGVDGVVLGLLYAEGVVMEGILRSMVERARPLMVTFHRAIDMSNDSIDALEAVIRCGCDRLLTSGRESTANTGKEMLKKLADQSAGRIQIIAASGIGVDNAQALQALGVDSLHMSASQKKESPMLYRREGLSMASTVPGEYDRVEADEDMIRQVVKLVKT
jgi:copper homeostasis protein